MSPRHLRFHRPGRNRSRLHLELLDDRSLPSVVFTTEDSGSDAAPTPGSLRAAIIAANTTPGPDTITFALKPTDPGHVYYLDDGMPGQVSVGNIRATTAPIGTEPDDIDLDWKHSWWSIRPPVALPEIVEAVLIDGYSQPGASPNQKPQGSDAVLRIELDGEKAGPASGLRIRAGGSIVRGLAINRFGASGIDLRMHRGDAIQGNYLGSDISGTLGLGNVVAGVRTANAGALIGGTDPKMRNLISGNQYGVLLSNSGTNFEVVIQGNCIGTDASGSFALGNSADGVNVGSAPGTRVGGPAPGAGNVISGNRTGVVVGGISHRVIDGRYNCLVQGNFIGLNAVGTAHVANSTGVLITNGDNLVGGLTANPGSAAGNVISGNIENGVSVVRRRPGPKVEGTVVQGNIIGLDAGGSESLGNGLAGFRTTDAGAQVGGTAPGARNVISANQYGVLLSNSGSNYATYIQGNFVGTDVGGNLDRGNSSIGVGVGSAPGTRVGGLNGAGNVISGNGVGVSIGSISHRVIAGRYNCLVQANLIGVNAAGTAPVGNTTGIQITNSDNLIGGDVDALRNIISGNIENGVHILRATAVRNRVLNNCIGTDITGTRPIQNGLDGVLLADTTAANVIEDNGICFNGRNGIGLENADKNFIRSNTSNRNVGDGVRLDDLSTGNVIKDNVLLENGEHDGHDDSVGTGTAGTANLWLTNWGVSGNRPGLFEP